MSPEIKCGDLILKFDLGEPSHYAKQKAIQELRETPENIENGLKELKRLLEDETTLVIPRDDNEWLLKFLRVCKFYPESARDLIKRFYSLRLKYSDITNRLIPIKLKPAFDNNLATIMPQRDQFGRRIIVTMLGKIWNTRLIERDDVFAGGILCSDAVQMEPETQINGVVYINDMEGMSLSQALQLTPSFVKRTLDYIQGNTPLRIKAYHFVNQPGIFQPVFAAAKHFFTQKYAKRLILHGSNYKSLHEYISPECLPECYGGTLKTELTYGPQTYELVSHYTEHFETVQKYGYNKNKNS